MTDRFEVLSMYFNLSGECLQMLLVGAFFFFFCRTGQGSLERILASHGSFGINSKHLGNTNFCWSELNIAAWRHYVFLP
jgi:hypothetical protein